MIFSISGLTALLDQAVNWFMPASMANDKDKRKQARLFLISHLFGPFLGNAVPLSLYIFDPTPNWDIAVLSLSISGFWILPFILRATGSYSTLVLISIQNLMFCILWSCYFYGGVTSPTLTWVLLIPLLAFFYVGGSSQLRHVLLWMFAANIAVFGLFSILMPAPAHGIPIQALQGLGIVSTMASAAYVTMMATYYARALSTQSELEAVMHHQRITAEHLRQATFEAERATKAKAEFLAKMSHELRTPLNAVIGYSQMLLEDAEDSGDTEDVPDIERIHTAGFHLLRLVNNILDLSKIEAGHMELFIEDFSLETLMNAVIDEVRSEAVRNGTAISLAIEHGLGTLHGDQRKTQVVISNVVQNAVKFTQGGSIDIRCSTDGENVHIRVEDDGTGIDEKDLPHIFDKFADAEDETSSKYGGTGVGLALARALCRMMGGTIEVRSTLGVGSIFEVILPVDVSVERQDNAAPGEGPAVVKALYPEAKPMQAEPYSENQKVA